MGDPEEPSRPRLSCTSVRFEKGSPTEMPRQRRTAILRSVQIACPPSQMDLGSQRSRPLPCAWHGRLVGRHGPTQALRCIRAACRQACEYAYVKACQGRLQVPMLHCIHERPYEDEHLSPTAAAAES